MFNFFLQKKFDRKELQFLIPIIICIVSFFIINIFAINDINLYSYWPRSIIKEPYRIISYNFIHIDINHLLSNIFGIVIIRYCFIKLNIKNNNLFYYLIILIIFFQAIYLYIFDVHIFSRYDYKLVGFSGIIFGSYSYLMMSSLYGSKFFFKDFIGLKKNLHIFQLMLIVLASGMIYSLLPGISLNGHFGGILSGVFIFYISQGLK